MVMFLLPPEHLTLPRFKPTPTEVVSMEAVVTVLLLLAGPPVASHTPC